MEDEGEVSIDGFNGDNELEDLAWTQLIFMAILRGLEVMHRGPEGFTQGRLERGEFAAAEVPGMILMTKLIPTRGKSPLHHF